MDQAPCPQCDGPVLPSRNPGRSRIYCSTKCCQDFGNAKNRVASGPLVRRKPRTTYAREENCLGCGKGLTGQQRRFCSAPCSWVYQNKSRNKGVAFHRITNVDPVQMKGDCSECGEGVRVLRAGRPDGVVQRFGCRKKTLGSKESRRVAGWRKRGIDLTYGQYEGLLESQHNLCAICSRDFGDLGPYVDHCHDKGHVRGLLCVNCNHGLGKFKDDPEALESAAAYLRRTRPPDAVD